MAQYKPPIRDMQFVLHELLDVESRLAELPSHADTGRELIDQVLEEGGRFCAEVLFPLNRTGDEEGCSYAGDGVVTTPAGFRHAWQEFTKAGWPTLTCEPAYGGQGLPLSAGMAFQEMLNSANQAWAMYPGLTHGAYECLRAHGTPGLARIDSMDERQPRVGLLRQHDCTMQRVVRARREIRGAHDSSARCHSANLFDQQAHEPARHLPLDAIASAAAE